MRTHRNLSRTVLALAVSGALVAGCSTAGEDADPGGASSDASASSPPADPGTVAGVDIPDGQIEAAVDRLDGLVDELMTRSGVPGMAVAVVHGGRTVYAKGFGVREVGNDQKVDADTVFQLASVSKSLSATVVAHQVGQGTVEWDTPVAPSVAGFALGDPWVSEHVSVADMFAHRSGLPKHAGDRLEDLGYDRTQVLERLRLLPLDPFRITYQYTNFGFTAGAEAVASTSHTDWATLSEQALYQPLGMTSTSSRFADYQARDNRSTGHMLVDGKYVADAVRDPDAQSPAGGASSSVNDMTKWLTMILGEGKYQGKQIVDAEALLPALTPQIVSSPAASIDSRAGSYGYGFNVSSTAAGRATISHSGAFSLGAATNFLAIPSADIGIVALTNGTPTGVPETLTAEFADLVQFGEIREDWKALYAHAFAPQIEPEGSLVGEQPPASPAPPQPIPSYVGNYANAYWGPAEVADRDGRLVLALGPDGRTFPLTHWDGDTFTFTISSENAPPGTVSKATFAGNTVQLEYFDEEGLGTFVR